MNLGASKILAFEIGSIYNDQLEKLVSDFKNNL